MSNVLAELAKVHLLAGNAESAGRYASAALELATRCGNGYAEHLAKQVLTLARRGEPV